MRAIKIALLTLCFHSSLVIASGLGERLYYLTPDANDVIFSKQQLQHIKNHISEIDILAPQIYALDENGHIHGELDPNLIQLANQFHKKLMPLVVNANFDQEKLHRVLQNPATEEKAAEEMRALCEKNHLYGLQFDMENIRLQDKDEFTRFFQLAAHQLHEGNFSISIAVVPPALAKPDNPFDQWYFENWSGAYDYRALGQSSDFISVMTYDLHTSLTTPGPTAPFTWVEQEIVKLRNDVPGDKISLGLAAYSSYFFTGQLGAGKMPDLYSYRSRHASLRYDEVVTLIHQFHLAPLWNKQWKSSYVMFENHHRNEFLFIENKKSWQEKVKLIKRYQLRGISVWRLGDEDPGTFEMG